MAKKSQAKSTTSNKEKPRVSIQIGRLAEPMSRAREWYADAFRIADQAKLTGNQIAEVAKAFHYLNSPYLWLERGGGEHKSWPAITPEAFALISACLLIQRVMEMQAAERAGKRTELDTAIDLFWLCRFAWNMEKVSKVTPAAARQVLSAGATKAAAASHAGRSEMKKEAQRLFLTAETPWVSLVAATRVILPEITKMKVSRPLAQTNAERTVREWLSEYVAADHGAAEKLTPAARARLKVS